MDLLQIHQDHTVVVKYSMKVVPDESSPPGGGEIGGGGGENPGTPRVSPGRGY